MNFDFAAEVRDLLESARRVAFDGGFDYLGTEHILLGALNDRRIRALLAGLGVQADQVKRTVEQLLPPEEMRSARIEKNRALGGRSGGRRGELPYTSRAKKVLEFSMAEAREAGESVVESEHILLGLIREGKGIAAEVLGEFGVNLPRARTARAAPDSPASSHFRVFLDDRSDLSIYEQIIAQVTEAVATGGLRPGERLPTVRRLADELDIAPGTVARAYSELERQKLVVTEGARGTRVADRPAQPVPGSDRGETLVGLLRPAAVAAFHLGGSAEEVRAALEEAMRGIFDRGGETT